jgi:hypothetical protein
MKSSNHPAALVLKPLLINHRARPLVEAQNIDHQPHGLLQQLQLDRVDSVGVKGKLRPIEPLDISERRKISTLGRQGKRGRQGEIIGCGETIETRI